MTTPDKKSHWASLANVLGAKIPPEKLAPYVPPAPAVPQPVEEAVVTEVPAAAPAPKQPSKAKPAAKAKDNWGSVLGMLGLRSNEPEEVAPEPPPPAPVAKSPPAPPERPAPVRESRPEPQREARNESPRESRDNDWEKPFLSAQPLPKNLWELVGDTSPPPKPTPVIEEVRESYAEVGGNDLALPEDEDGDWKPERSGAAGRGRDDDRSRRDRGGEEGGRPRRRRRRRRHEPGVESADVAPASSGDYHDEPSYRDEPEFASDDDLPISAVDRDDDDSPAPREAASGEEGEGRPRRRRRRRGRGRGRGSDREAAPATGSAAPASRASFDDDVDHEEDVEEVVSPRGGRSSGRAPAPQRNAPPASRGGSGRMRGREDEIEDTEEDDHEEIDMTEHRGIPTWHEAMAIVVGTNMEARAKNPGGNRGGGGGRGRGGRGRGGRGRS